LGKITWRLLGIIGAFFGVFLRFDAQRIFERKSPQGLYLCG
jgi:hypothetical protein